MTPAIFVDQFSKILDEITMPTILQVLLIMIERLQPGRKCKALGEACIFLAGWRKTPLSRLSCESGSPEGIDKTGSPLPRE
jgi:hypothetical protein